MYVVLQFDRDAIQQSVRAWGSAAPLEKQQAFPGKHSLVAVRSSSMLLNFC